MQDTALFSAALPDSRQGGIQPHFGSHETGQLFKEPQIGLFGLGAVPFVGAGQVKSIFCGASGKGKLLLNILAELITIAFSGKNQSLPTIGPVIEIFSQDSGFVEGKAISILNAVIEVDDLKTGGLRRLLCKGKRFLWQSFAFEQLGIPSADHLTHEQECMEDIALSGRICAVQCKDGHELLFVVR